MRQRYLIPTPHHQVEAVPAPLPECVHSAQHVPALQQHSNSCSCRDSSRSRLQSRRMSQQQLPCLRSFAKFARSAVGWESVWLRPKCDRAATLLTRAVGGRSEARQVRQCVTATLSESGGRPRSRRPAQPSPARRKHTRLQQAAGMHGETGTRFVTILQLEA